MALELEFEKTDYFLSLSVLMLPNNVERKRYRSYSV